MAREDLQIDWLQAFVTVVGSGSLTAAAAQLARSQSAVSMQIKKLEAAVGRPLLLRGPRHLSLTPAGEELLGYARKLLSVHSEALLALRGARLQGKVSLGIPDDYALGYLTPLLNSFAAQQPAVEVSLVCEPSTRLIPKVESGELDVAIVTRDKPQRGELLFREELVWVGNARQETWRQTPLPIAVYELGSQARSRILKAVGALGRSYRVVYSSPSVAGQLAVAESGAALGVLTRCSVPASLQILGAAQGLPGLPMLEVVALRCRASATPALVDALYGQVLQTLRRDFE
ncbi:LysR family transcriptional regulator [Phytopseudomonas dryadis]|uniref:LysR family transcriptional regulator n=1 Tax=Phytopseudomonas dryadis TaxID=2487520 RepID=A0A4Q9R3F7_9GAMM|nr:MULTISPECIES: LysR family transcriptional regulator [Pseudomonas]TBU93968.1 LysR family transcriptional regulator [Pseudomonas dryadis]TBV07870.1 LysR family transcriptional regulator [Pseudomonas dryadis]TBV19265.1 LysR family transcriptional regulator [Pseudomonas sp. FRB 230]